MTDRPLADGTRDVRRWPSDPLQLVDTGRCPACFTPLAGPRCRACDLDLDVPAAAELLALSTRVYDGELARQSLISQMRAAQAARTEWAQAEADVRVAPPVAAAGSVDAAVAVGSAAAFGSAVAAGPSAGLGVAPVVRPEQVTATLAPPPLPPAANPAPGPAAPSRPARSGVQVLLLTLGVVLISVTAVVFLFVAYLVASLEVRSVIIAGASVLVLGAAWLLRARRLPGTAEGVASVAIVLLLLDVWIVRANDLFGTSALSTSGYTGIALLVVAGLLAATRAASGIRVTGFAAAALVPVAAFLLASSAVLERDPATGAWVGGMAAAVTGALGSLLIRPPAAERVILLCAAFTGGALALVFGASAIPDIPWNELWCFLAVALAWLVILAALRRAAIAPAFSIVAACAAGVSGALAPAVGVLGEVEAGVALWVAPALAGVVTCLAAWATRLPAPARAEAFAAFFAAAAVASAAALPAALAGLAAVGGRLASSLPPFADGGRSLMIPPEVEAGAILGSLRRFAAIPMAAAAAGVVATGGVVHEPGVAVAVLLALATVALLLAASGVVRGIPGALPTLAAFGIGASALAWWTGFSSTSAWPWAMLASLVLAIGGRIAASRVWGAGGVAAAAVHVVVTALIAAVVLFTVAPWLASAGAPLAEPWNQPWLWLGIGAPVLLAAAMFVPGLSRLDRTCAALPLLTASLASSIAAAVDGAAAIGWLPAGLTAVVGLIGIRGTTNHLVVRLLLAAATPALLAIALTAGFVGAGVAIEPVAPAIGALLGAALGHVVLDRAPTTRAVWTIAVLVTSVVALAVGLTIDERWLVLLLLTPVPLLLAALGGDPVRSVHGSRHLAWLSLPLAVGAVWTWLAGEAVDDVEAYTLPLAATLAATGALITWRRTDPSGRGSGRTALIAAAAAVAVLPSVASSGDSELRTLVLVAAGTVVAIAGLFLPDSARSVPVRLIAVATGWVALTGAALVRGATVALGGAEGLPIEFWPALALVAGAGIAVAWANAGGRPAGLAEAGLAASVVSASIPTVVAISAGDASVLRSALLFPLLAVVHVVSVWSTRRPLGGPALQWSSLAVLVVGGLAAIGLANVDPFDLVTVPLAAALLGAGAVRMRRSGELGSWHALGAGLAVLLVPPLLADVVDPELWRIVALGVVAAIAVVVGAMRRLQAPLLIGGAVLLVHALWQLWPWITDVYEAVWWWLWLGIAGVVLVVLAATYERQLRLARGVVRSIAGLR